MLLVEDLLILPTIVYCQPDLANRRASLLHSSQTGLHRLEIQESTPGLDSKEVDRRSTLEPRCRPPYHAVIHFKFQAPMAWSRWMFATHYNSSWAAEKSQTSLYINRHAASWFWVWPRPYANLGVQCTASATCVKTWSTTASTRWPRSRVLGSVCAHSS